MISDKRKFSAIEMHWWKRFTAKQLLRLHTQSEYISALLVANCEKHMPPDAQSHPA